MRKAHRKRPDIAARTPSALAHDLVKRRMKHQRVDRLPKRLLSVSGQAYDRPRPGRRIVLAAGEIAPHDGAPLFGKFAGKGVVDPDKALLDELFDLRAAERTRVF